MTTKQQKHHHGAQALGIVFFAIAAFVALSLVTGRMGPVGMALSAALSYLVGSFAWAMAFELALVGVTLVRGRKLAATLSLVAGDAVLGLALVVLFRSGSIGQVVGDGARAAVSVVGTALIVLAVAAVLAVSRTSLVMGFVVHASRAAYAHWMASRAHTEPFANLIAPPAAMPKNVRVEKAIAPAVVSPIVVTVAPIAPLAVRAPRGGFALPSAEFLAPASDEGASPEPTEADGVQLVSTLATYGVDAKIERVLPGPTVTTFELSVTAGTKLSKLVKLESEMSLALGCKLRVVPARAGRVGFEVPNAHRDPVNLRALIEDEQFQSMKEPLPIVLGRDMQGNAVYGDLSSMPHVIVAGASGSGKSVGLNVMLASLLCRRTPDELRFIMIDPKVVELAPYDRIPHMLLPVVTDMKKAAEALKWAVTEMERRYQLFATAGAKNITSYNAKATAADRIPFIVIVVDEFADLIMQQGKDVESAVVRLGQKARAAGMHMILATQRPSVDVITGTIKANFSSRLAYKVAQSVDSRTIIDEQGAEQLLGAGDMLAKLNGSTEARRVQCPMISEDEIAALTSSLRAAGQPSYNASILRTSEPAPERKVRIAQQAAVAS